MKSTGGKPGSQATVEYDVARGPWLVVTALFKTERGQAVKEIEQLRADLATLEAARKIGGLLEMTRAYIDGERDSLKERIADLEAQQAQVDEWAGPRIFVEEILADSSFSQRFIWLARYAKHLQVKVAELDHELRCERIDGGKVRDDRKAILAEQNRQELAELTTIANAIPPACGLAKELVEKRIIGVKKELQRNGN